MADLPMAQIPNFSLGATPTTDSIGKGAAQGFQSGMGNQLKQQAINVQQQQLAQQKHEKMLEVGADMVINGGDDSQDTGQNLIRQAFPYLTGQPIPQGVPIDKPLAKSIQYYHNATKLYSEDPTNPLALSPKDAIAGILQDVSRKGLKQQQAQMDILKADPMYKEATADQTGGQVNGQPAIQNSFTGNVSGPTGQPMPGAQGNFITSGQAATLQQDKLSSGQRNFQENTKDQQAIFPDYSDLQTALSYKIPTTNPDGSPHAATQAEKDELVSQQRMGVLKLAQMQNPSTHRLQNPMSLEEMAQSGLLKSEASEAYNKYVETGAPMPTTMAKSILNAGTKLAVNAEKTLTQKEISAANMAKQNGLNPMQVLQNFRTNPQIASTSPFFPNPSTLRKPLIGGIHQLKVNGVGGTYQLMGTDPNPASGNWQPAPQGSNGQ